MDLACGVQPQGPAPDVPSADPPGLTTPIWAWGFLPPLEAFFIANLFHGLQYFAIVWCVEKKNVRRVFGLGRIERGSFLALLAFAAVLLGGGFLYEIGLNASLRWSASVALVVSLMHFWYDGFVWSVRKREV